MNGVSGLSNLGNTCYINSVLQILHRIDVLNEYIKKKTPHPIEDSILPTEWISLKEMMDTSVIINPQRFIHMNKILFQKKNKNEFLNHQQGDASEYVFFILECIHNAYNLLESPSNQCPSYIIEYEKKDYSIISQLFVSVLEMVYLDIHGNKMSTKYETQWTLDLPIPVGSTTLEQCLDSFFSDEKLCDKWYNDKTSESIDVIRKSKWVVVPNILVVNLKRWTGIKKNNVIIKYDTSIDLFKYSNIHSQYRLFGIINHTGSVRSGHYFSFVEKDNQWYVINDTHISMMPLDKLVSSSNYCLFYKKLK